VPSRGLSKSLQEYLRSDTRHEDLEVLWQELRPFYEYFETHHRVSRASIDAKSGVYTLIAAPAS